MKIYYRLNMYLKKEDAQDLCNICRFTNLPIYEVNLENFDNNQLLHNRLEKIVNLKYGTTAEAVSYFEYLTTKGNNEKFYILKCLAFEEKNIEDFLNRFEYLRKLLTTDDELSKNDSKFILSTIHSSKGLEYNNVYLLDMIDSVIPNVDINNPDSQKIEEEESRIFYVGMTRAKNNLFIFKDDSLKATYVDYINKISNKVISERQEKIKQSEIDKIAYKQVMDFVKPGAKLLHKNGDYAKVISVDDRLVIVKFDKRADNSKYLINMFFDYFKVI